MNERWKDVKGYEGIYKMNEIGEIINIKRIASLEQWLSKNSFIKGK